MKVDFNNLASVITIGLLCWGALQLYHLKADTAVITYRVGANYDMIKPMWQDFLVRNAYHDQPQPDGKANIHATNRER